LQVDNEVLPENKTTSNFSWGVQTLITVSDISAQASQDNLVLNSTGGVIQNNTTPAPPPPPAKPKPPPVNNTTPPSPPPPATPALVPEGAPKSNFDWTISTEISPGDIANQITNDNLILNNTGGVI